ncbi:hypothetical protein [Bradyrhizobium sp. RT10b]|uniref:hypothetical protein n=1 Tax=Bradyrhizobium sp. RT10b TaxID=3156331 RepID=UPI003390D317
MDAKLPSPVAAMLPMRLQERRQSPAGRPSTTDGASGPRNINRRLLWLVSEKLVDYCSRHRISFNWRLDGRLKGLKKMIDERRG